MSTTYFFNNFFILLMNSKIINNIYKEINKLSLYNQLNLK